MTSFGARNLRSRKTALGLAALATLGLALTAPAQPVNQPGVVISGVVKESTGQPVAYAWVKAELFPMHKTVSRLTNAEGKYQLRGLEAGSYRVRVEQLGYRTSQKRLALHDGQRVSLNFTIEKGLDLDQLSSAQWAAWFPQNEDTDLLAELCSGCHNLSTVAEKRGKTKEQWKSITYAMSDDYMIPDLGPKLLERMGAILAKYWGPDSRMPGESDLPQIRVDEEALQATYIEYDIPLPSIRPHSATVDEHDRVWISGYDWVSNAVAMFDIRTEKFQFWEMPTARSSPHTFAFDQEGNVWIPQSISNKLGVIDPRTGEFEEYEVPASNGFPYPHSAAIDSKGIVWITCSFGDQLAEFDPKTKKMTLHKLPADHKGSGFGYILSFIQGRSSRGKVPPISNPDSPLTYSIAIDSQDNVWFTEYSGNRIVKFVPSTEEFTTYTPELRGSTPRGMLIDSHDNVWFANFAKQRIGVLVPATGEITQYKVPTLRGTPYALAIDSAGNIWYSDFDGNKIGKFDPRTKKFVEFPLPSTIATPRFFGFDSKGRLWYSEFMNGKIGAIDFGLQ